MRRRRIDSKDSFQVSTASEEDRRLKNEEPTSTRWSDWNVLIFSLIFRAINSLLVQTYFSPDEHWQSLEVAHRIVFGYGHLTWEWEKGLRSYLHPMIFALLYKILAVLKLDTVWFMSKGPRLLQSVFAAYGDLYLYKLAFSIFGKRASKWALFCQMTNWFMFFCITRTLLNSIETVLTTVALFYWPLPAKVANSPSSRKLALFLAAISCAIRPTSGIIWLYLGFLHFWETQDGLRFLFLEVIPIGCVVLVTTCLLDRWMYGTWILVPLNFLIFNFFNAGGDYYGTHPWHWYFTQGFPTIAFTFLPLSIAGVWLSKELRLAGLVLWDLVLYSFLGHKEFRFVMPVLPVALMFSGYTLAEIDSDTSQSRKSKKSNKISVCSWKYLIVTALLTTNVPTALYTSLIHQRGSEAVIQYLAKEALNHHVESIVFLTQCHATPYYSSLHQNIPMTFLDCTPRDNSFVNQRMEEYCDESDCFMKDPAGFLSRVFHRLPLPSHIVLFDSEAIRLREVLDSHGYVMVKSFFHAHFPVDRHLQGYVLVYQHT